MSSKRAFLLARARTFEMEDLRGCYSPTEQLNLTDSFKDRQAVVMQAGFARTESKTMVWPGDDDPDPEAEGCY